MKKHTRGDARPGRFSKTRASVDYYKARVLYFSRSNLSKTFDKPVLSTLQQLGSKFALLSVVIPLSVLSFVLLTQKTAPVQASNFSEGIVAPNQLVEGTLVSLITTEPASVELADINKSNYLAGVVEAKGDGLLVSDTVGANVYVATAGIVKAFISDINGEIKAGDFIGASWIKGVGMKVLEVADNDQKILGVALQDLNTEDAFAYTAENIETPSGKKTAKIGKISIKIFTRDIGPYATDDGKSALEGFASNLAGKEVSLVRIFASLILFSVSVAISGVFMANAIRSGLTSIGRNPLASQSIFTALTQISGVSIGLIVLGAAVAYAVLVI